MLIMEYANDVILNCSQDSLGGSTRSFLQNVAFKNEIPDDFDDNLDHIVLRDRRTMLLSRILLQSKKSFDEGNGKGVTALSSRSARMQENHCESTMPAEFDFSAKDRCNVCQASNPLNSNVSGAHPDHIQGVESVGSRKSAVADSQCHVEKENWSCNPDKQLSSAFTSLPSIKSEPLEVDHFVAKEKYVGNASMDYILSVKTEPGYSTEASDDYLDHLRLVDRVKLLAEETSCSINYYQDQSYKKATVPSTLDLGLDVSASVEPISVWLPRKRKRTATRSVETALEEDAPGLLKVLMEKGVSVDELKLYDGLEDDDVTDDSLIEDSFSELEAIISQVFSHRQSSLKFPLLRGSKNTKASYYLACLVSLVEQWQARYLRKRKWPVEWGWCRDLQCFVFVFKRHNRIVLERPEYGYATYFFELLDCLPVNWQIKRLVTAMKLTSCGRITLIEDKPLVVGEDLSEGEARVLAEYGWTPNTGLGTMLNYCDRVFHDRKDVLDGSEWRNKIATLLVNGYNGGNIVLKDVPKKFSEFEASQGLEIKLEVEQ